MAIIAEDARIEVQMPAQPDLPERGDGGTIKLFANDGAGGAVDYETPIAGDLAAWPSTARGTGAGLGAAGEFAAGLGAVGVGAGEFFAGFGFAGFGIAALVVISKRMADGTYNVAAVAYDAAGNASGAPHETDGVVIAGTPKPPGKPTAEAYESGSDTLRLGWLLSGDDEG